MERARISWLVSWWKCVRPRRENTTSAPFALEAAVESQPRAQRRRLRNAHAVASRRESAYEIGANLGEGPFLVRGCGGPFVELGLVEEEIGEGGRDAGVDSLRRER